MRKAIAAARQTQGVRSVRSDLQIDRDYYPYRANDPYHGRYYPGWAYDPYDRYEHAHVDLDYYIVDVDDAMNADGFRGLHAMPGEVTKLDRQKGQLALRTPEGTLQLHVPPSALRDVNQGDRITIRLGIKPADVAGAASPGT